MDQLLSQLQKMSNKEENDKIFQILSMLGTDCQSHILLNKLFLVRTAIKESGSCTLTGWPGAPTICAFWTATLQRGLPEASENQSAESGMLAHMTMITALFVVLLLAA